MTSRRWRWTGLLAGFFLAVGVAPQARGEEKPVLAAAARPAVKPKLLKPEADWHVRRGTGLQRSWGVDVVGVRRVSSGLMLRFDYRVVDPEKAAVLTDRKAKPYLIDEATGAAFSVPAMENIGELRQVAPLENTRTYFMIFGNPGGMVKKGARVTIVAGAFRAEGLEVN